MPSKQQLLEISSNADKNGKIAKFVEYAKYYAEQTAEAGGWRIVLDIYRSNSQFAIIDDILNALTEEFSGCNIKIHSWTNDGSRIYKTDDPNIKVYELVITWGVPQIL